MSVRDDNQATLGVGTTADAGPDRVLSCRDLVGGFGPRPVIAGVDIEVHAGETVAIVGRSGCGKTTLLSMLAGLLTPTAGRLDAAPAALMPQRDGLLEWASATRNAALPLRLQGVSRREAHHLAHGQLAALGLGASSSQRVARLSGGMRQRVALARTLLTGRRLLLLDEPLASVDALTRDELHDLLLTHLRSGGRGAVLVTHDLEEAVRLADRVLVLRPLGSSGAGPSTLVAGPTLSGRPGDRIDARGGEALRAGLREALDG